MNKPEVNWKEELTDEQYRILRKKGTEMPHSGTYNLHFEKGTYCCAGCNEPLFESSTKFDAHCGWPSFDKEVREGAITEIRDVSGGMVRTEILCTKCGGHLGHVFDDGPTETKLRYCVNSLSLSFDPEEK